MVPRRSFIPLALTMALAGAWACARADEGSLPESGPGGAPTTGPTGPTAPGTGGFDGSAGETGSGGAGLTSGEFGSDEPAPDAPVECEPLDTNTCDWSRLDGCCRAHACERASGTDVFNTYPVESCQSLVACVQSHAGCSNPDDPLCFRDEAPDAPCLSEGYQASHEDPDGPFAWTADLVRCVCGV